ncbi:hypothetical protein HanIR_Chr02g0052481 [Helianthus annuus]|nr:hypothetical protein HanIR_Chr02g0052481 [Helianthus annuus]
MWFLIIFTCIVPYNYMSETSLFKYLSILSEINTTRYFLGINKSVSFTYLASKQPFLFVLASFDPLPPKPPSSLSRVKLSS